MGHYVDDFLSHASIKSDIFWPPIIIEMLPCDMLCDSRGYKPSRVSGRLIVPYKRWKSLWPNGRAERMDVLAFSGHKARSRRQGCHLISDWKKGKGETWVKLKETESTVSVGSLYQFSSNG